MKKDEDIKYWESYYGYDNACHIAEVIAKRETAMLEEIEKPLSLSVMFQESFDDSLGLTEARKALAIIQRRKGDHA